jgi:hypothetical protein
MRILTASFFFCLLIASFAPHGATQAPVGYVAEIHGDWYVDGNTASPLKRWQKLQPNSTVGMKSPTPDARIVIFDMSGKLIASRNCEAVNCSHPFKLPASSPQRSLLGVAFDATVGLLFGSPDKYSIHRERTSESALSDGVVKLEGGQIDFSPILKLRGRYYLSWRSLPRSGEPGKWANSIEFRTKRGQPALVTVPGLEPGLYEINLQRPVWERYQTFASAWVLVSTAPEYENAAASFRQAVELTKQWGGQVERDTSRQFLLAHLDYLAEQTGK